MSAISPEPVPGHCSLCGEPGTDHEHLRALAPEGLTPEEVDEWVYDQTGGHA